LLEACLIRAHLKSWTIQLFGEDSSGFFKIFQDLRGVTKDSSQKTQKRTQKAQISSVSFVFFFAVFAVN
jgi:hypothetical protein